MAHKRNGATNGFVSGLPDRTPRKPPSIESSVERVREARNRRKYGAYRGPKRTAHDMARIKAATNRMIGGD